MRHAASSITMFLIAAFFPLGLTFAQEFDERFSDWPLQLKINGRLIVADTLKDISPIGELISRSDRGKKLTLLCPEHLEAELLEGYSKIFEGEIEVVHGILDVEQTDTPTVIAWHSSRSFRPDHQYLNRHRIKFEPHLSNGNTLIIVGSAARWASKLYVTNSNAQPAVKEGANLLLDSVLQLSYDPTTDRTRLLSVLAASPKCVGIGLEAETALLLSGRKMIVAGQGGATLHLTSNDRTPNRIETIVPRESDSTRRQPVTDFLADLTEWRRDAIDRTLEQFPAEKPRVPNSPNGTLFIVGGGGTPQGLMSQFVEAAGGAEKAKLVYVPCSESDEVGERQRTVEMWQRMGVKNATFIHTKDRTKANEDPSFYSPLVDATGIWFGGGRQWNFSDSYYGTTTHNMMKEVLKRGGVVGGSSAGASIQARYLCRATPIENFRPMAPGYERGGLGFISGVAIDQHFSQRRRQKDMTSLVNRYPQLLGIGIDEATAIIVRGSKADVVGRGKVHFYDRSKPVYPDQADYEALKAGQSYDLAKRKIIPSEAH